MGKKTRQQQKAFQLKLNVPDQRHLDYLANAHAIHSSRMIGANRPMSSFENFLLDCVFKTANEEIKAYNEAVAKQQAELAKEKENAQTTDSNEESTTDNAEELGSEDTNS